MSLNDNEEMIARNADAIYPDICYPDADPDASSFKFML